MNSATFPLPDRTARQLTTRAIVTGMVLGALLAPCNIYAGLKIGWSFNMSISAALLSYAFWQMLHRGAGTTKWGLLENNVNQTAASAAASIASAGLVAPIPALAMITGQELSYPLLVIWVLSVSLVGVAVAVGLRRQMLEIDRLPFPAGIATAETIKEIYARGTEALSRVKVLLGAGGVAATLKLVGDFLVAIPKVGLGSWAAFKLGGKNVTLHNLGFVLDPSLLMVGFGAIIGIRAGLSLLLGAVLAWSVVGPMALDRGWAEAGTAAPHALWFGPMVEWLLWPGVAMMVTASLTSFAFSWRSIAAAMRGRGRLTQEGDDIRAAVDVPRRWFLAGLLVAGAFAAITQVAFWGIGPGTAVLGVMLTFVLAVVAGRVSGETGITPIGAMGKVTQLMFGIISPGQPAANLMAANVTGGAAGQCADMLHDLKCGLLIGASPRAQAVGQSFGIVAGALAGSAAYLLFVGDPAETLITEEWPAPAVATWKAVAEVFMHGSEAMPTGALEALVIAGAAGVILAVLEKILPQRHARWLPSPASVGLAFVIPAWNSLSMFFGAAIAVALRRYATHWSERFLIVAAAGFVAGESLAGVATAIAGVLGVD